MPKEAPPQKPFPPRPGTRAQACGFQPTGVREGLHQHGERLRASLAEGQSCTGAAKGLTLPYLGNKRPLMRSQPFPAWFPCAVMTGHLDPIFMGIKAVTLSQSLISLRRNVGVGACSKWAVAHPPPPVLQRKASSLPARVQVLGQKQAGLGVYRVWLSPEELSCSGWAASLRAFCVSSHRGLCHLLLLLPRPL